MVLASTGRRPRAHSASSFKAHQVLQPLPSGSAYLGHGNGFFGTLGAAGAGGVGGGPGGGISGKTLSYSSPELRSMLVGLETTVPQNLNPPSHLGSRHKPCKKRRKIGGSRSSLYQLSVRQDSEAMMGSRQSDPDPGASCRCSPCCAPGARGCRCCNCCGAAEEEESGGGHGCCRVQILLVLLQLLLGAGVTSVAVYMHLFHRAAFVLRDTPMWAGAPLCCAGVVGIYFCASNFKEYSKTTRAFVLKVLCSILSAGSVFLCVLAAIFAAIHLGRALTYSTCVPTEGDCLCRLPQDMADEEDEVIPRVFLYPAATPAQGQGQGPGPAEPGDCQVVIWQVKTYLATSGSLCLAGSLVSLWFVALLWKARYGRFHSGVRLPSIRRKYYSAPHL